MFSTELKNIFCIVEIIFLTSKMGKFYKTSCNKKMRYRDFFLSFKAFIQRDLRHSGSACLSPMERVRSESSLPPLQSETMAGGGCTSFRRCKGLFGSLDMARDQRISHLVSSKAVFTHVPSGHKIISKCGVIV